MAKDLITVLNDIIDAIDGQAGSNENVDDILTALDGIANAIRNSGGGGGGDYVPRDQHGYNANKYLKVDEDGYVIPVFPTIYDLDDIDINPLDVITGDALTYSYAADGTMTWSNVPLMYSCSLAESDFGGSSTYTYLLLTNRHHQDGSDLEFYIEQGSRVVVYDPDTGTPALFSIGFVILNNGEMDERGNMLYEVWFIDMTQGHSPLVVRRFRKTYIEDAEDYYYIEVT